MIKLEDDIEEILQKSACENGIPYELAVSIIQIEMSKAHMGRRPGINSEIRNLIRQYVANNITQLTTEIEGGISVAD